MTSLSIIVVVHDMEREAPRTLHSLSRVYQRLVDDVEYEVIVVENGSSSFDPSAVSAFGPEFSYLRLDRSVPSPARAINLGARQARGSALGLMIDGARICSPGIVAGARTALDAFDRVVVGTLAFHLGPDVQMLSVTQGYDEATEDRLLADCGWDDDGYRLFDISSLAGSSAFGYFQPLDESNCLFLSRALFEELGGFEERFRSPGGGFVNLDFYRRAVELPDARLAMLLGEGTFHQVHGGIMTNADPETSASRWRAYDAEYQAIYGRPFQPSPKRPIVIGTPSPAALPWIRRSCDLFPHSPHASRERPEGVANGEAEP